MEAILSKIKQQMDEQLYHGASLAIYREGKWQEHYLGTQDGKEPTSPGLVYDLASVSKVVGVATICIFLLRSGRIYLDDTLNSHYPAVKDESITLRQLLTHTTGIDPYIPNRDRLTEAELKEAIHQIQVTDDKSFLYTDINFLLLGFMLEFVYGKHLDEIFSEMIFEPWGMAETGFGPMVSAVPTVKGVLDGRVHDPKAKVFGVHAGSAGLFSTIEDLETFCNHYLEDDFAENLWANISHGNKERSIGWNLEGDWIDHTGYTGPFVMINRKEQCAVIFLTNRTFEYDDRPLWIAKRRELRDVIKESLEC